MTAGSGPVAAGSGEVAVAGGSARVTFVISGLVVGGAERVLTALANGWAEQGRAVTIVTLDGPRIPPFFPVDPRVDVRRLGLAGTSRGVVDAVRNNLRRLVGLRRAIARTRPDVVVSFMDRTNVLTLLATFGAPWPIVVSDRTAADPGSNRIWRILRRLAYRRASTIVMQTEGSLAALDPSLRRRAVAIPNPVPAGIVTADASEPVTPEPQLVVALGRLVPQKGFDVLIETFASVVARVPSARLEIWGEGPERPRLDAIVERASLTGCVTLPGETRDPASVLRRAGIFVLSSRVEGFPNVLLEAMALGRPVVAMACTYGPAEIVRDRIDGRLVPAQDGGGLADALVEMLLHPDRAEELGARARDVRERFAFEAVLGRWSALVDGLRRRRRTG